MGKSTLGDRIQELRKQKGWSQSELAAKIDISYTQMSRYEIKGVQPPANILSKLANNFGTTVDFLVNGATEDKAKATLKDTELLNQFKAIEQMTDKDRNIVKTLIDAFITKRQIQQLAH